MRRLILATIVVLHATGCSTTPRISVAQGSTGAAAVAIDASTPASIPMVLAQPNYPLSIKDRATTDGRNFLANLNGRLAGLAKTQTAHSRAVQAGVLYQRFQALGVLEDLDSAYDILSELTAQPAATSETLLLGATLHAYLHEFDAALSLLDRLDQLDQAATSASLRLEIASARGMPPLAQTPPPGAKLTPGQEYRELVQLANDCIDRGELDCASSHFHDAQFVYTDVSPLPLAWLHTQQGIALLRFDQPELAIRFFRSALERVPGYALAMEHLAQCLVRAKAYGEARKLYLQVITQTQNPEDMAGLAILESQAGNKSQALTWLTRAKTAYAERLRKFPTGYAQHAVKFYLLIGDLPTAAKLAEANFKIRTDASSHITLASVRLSQSDRAAACQLLASVRASGRRPPELSALQQQLGGCAP
jgi:tetratricopeptide (TPR) repeat protein